MVIGGFQKNSLIDFPQTLACVVFTIGCNLKCPYCHNPKLATSPVKQGNGMFGSKQENTGIQKIDEHKIFSFLERRRHLLEGVVVSGGEPTLQADLEPFMEKVRQLGFKIKLDSNGTRPKILANLFEKGLVDYTAMDIKTSLDLYATVARGNEDIRDRVMESIRLIMEKSPAYEFRTTCIRPFITKEIMKDISRMIQGADRYVLQNCTKNVNVLEPKFLEDNSRFFSIEELQELGRIISGSVKALEVR